MIPTQSRRNPTARLGMAFLGLALLAVTVAPDADAAITRPFVARSTLNLAPGIRYQVGTMRTTGGRRQSVRVATVDGRLPGVSVRSLLSNDVVIRKERPSHMAERKSRPGYEAMVAINGDRSVTGRVDAYAAPHSMHISNGELMVAQPCTRPTLGIDSTGKARIDDVRVLVTALEDGLKVPKRILRVNTHRDDNKVVLYTRRFGPSTQTASGGLEVVLDMSGKLRPSGTQRVKVIAVRRGAGDTRLNWAQGVLSVKGDQGQWVKNLRVGQWMTLRTQIVRNVNHRCRGIIQEASGWNDIREAIGGNFFVARNGQVRAPSASTYPAGAERHPRTSAGVTADGRVLMVTVDGRQPGYSIGVKLAEMGQLLLSLGATDALNLDGGGSTVMARRVLRTGEFKVANRPSDGRERVMTNALVAFEVGSG